MYNLSYYKENDRQVLLDFIKQNSFAILVGAANDVPAATQIPILIEERGGKVFLKGHFLRQTDHHLAFEINTNALCLFTGPHSYVSASLYTNPQTASTWNYMTVHARGVLNFLNNDDLLKILEATTDLYENNVYSAASFKNLPKEYIEKLAKAIIAFEIEVKEMDGVFKLSQNRDEQSYKNIIQHLELEGCEAKAIAAEMKKRQEKLFDEK